MRSLLTWAGEQTSPALKSSPLFSVLYFLHFLYFSYLQFNPFYYYYSLALNWQKATRLLFLLLIFLLLLYIFLRASFLF
ncbi:hypothetical protein BX661DRAFT_181742 [Kickxella alabastrina]|uniref:uncharacterized protein n=1 Tax=Kickxella alabastrina TaxID=61397 RepID=UPI00221F0F75|nr:uncharacterized protein BX661DRAFT_181742 [Kickxella alabastrina]KAI7829303.1 hypothetical protein BX661DRAFT_181742 [Kickxella alabastrina]